MTLIINPDETALTMRRKPKTNRDRCSECLAEYQLKADGTIRHHLGDREYPGSRWRKVCPGVGKKPAVMHPPVAVEIIRRMFEGEAL